MKILTQLIDASSKLFNLKKDKEEVIYKCGGCGNEGPQQNFFDDQGVEVCTFCQTDIYLDTKEAHDEANPPYEGESNETIEKYYVNNKYK